MLTLNTHKGRAPVSNITYIRWLIGCSDNIKTEWEREREKISNRSPKTTHNLPKKNLFYILPKPEKNSRENVAKFSFRFSASVNTFFHYQVRQSNNSRFYILPTKLFFLFICCCLYLHSDQSTLPLLMIPGSSEKEKEKEKDEHKFFLFISFFVWTWEKTKFSTFLIFIQFIRSLVHS